MKGTLTCPKCLHEQEMAIPQNRCVTAYTCAKCKSRNKPKDKCCVFCEFGNLPCPVSHSKN